jgi:hypothetical protein
VGDLGFPHVTSKRGTRGRPDGSETPLSSAFRLTKQIFSPNVLALWKVFKIVNALHLLSCVIF